MSLRSSSLLAPALLRRYLLCVVFLSALIWFLYAVAHVNATTAGFAILLLVLGIASRWGLSEAVFTSVLAVLGYNYFFLPPVGTLQVADPANWIALFALLVTSVVVSRLSTRARQREQEASARRSEIERLYALSRVMLMTESRDAINASLHSIAEVFGLDRAAFFDADSGTVYGTLDSHNVTRDALSAVAATHTESSGTGFAMVPVNLGTRTIGALALEGRTISEGERSSIANLVAINYARAEALDRAANAEAGRRSEQLKTSVLDGIAHDLKTPLTAIKTCVTTMLHIPPRTEEGRIELLSIIDEETDRLQRKITEAIQLARIEASKLVVDRGDLPVNAFIREVLASFGDPERFELSIPECLNISADAWLLGAAMRQIVDNALKYSPPGALIEIAAVSRENAVEISVADRGPGIAPSDLKHVFEKFYRGTRGRQSVEGTGMGLSITRGIIEAHGGSIEIENRSGGGAVVTFRIPVRPS